jgi:hypothetical protein
VESTDENTVKNNHFPDKKCVCCLNTTSGIRNGSDDKSDSVSNETYAVANQTPNESSPENGSTSSNKNVHIFSSLDNKSTSTPQSTEKKELDVTNDSILLSESPSLSKDFNTTGYVIPVVILILIVLVFHK